MVRFIWKKNYIINKSRDFIYLKKYGRKYSFPHFIVWFSNVERVEPPVRLAVVASKRIGKAVLRNRIRRIIREFFRLNQYNLKKGDYVVIIKKVPKNLSLKGIHKEFSPLLAG